MNEWAYFYGFFGLLACFAVLPHVLAGLAVWLWGGTYQEHLEALGKLLR